MRNQRQLKTMKPTCSADGCSLRNAFRAVGAGALLIGIVLMTAAPATATSILISTGGTFASGTANSTWTSPGATWSISFSAKLAPSVSSYTTGSFFNIPFTNFVYTLNGSPVSVGAVDVDFFSTSSQGLMNVCFFGCDASGSTLINGFILLGDQLYVGTEAAPTIIPGSYAETSNIVYVLSAGKRQPLGTVEITTDTVPPAEIPEPSTVGLGAVGLLILAVMVFRRKNPRGWQREPQT